MVAAIVPRASRPREDLRVCAPPLMTAVVMTSWNALESDKRRLRLFHFFPEIDIFEIAINIERTP